MDCRNFLKTAASFTLLAIGATTGISQLFADALSSLVMGKLSDGNTPDIDSTMEYRKLGGMKVSVIGWDCLPMVSYYSRKYDKRKMITLIRRTYDKDVKKRAFSTA